MKILSLRIAGFGPFRDEQTVDFEAFDDDGIFLISGKTGAGKSSILDAVCFALYGSVPRYEASDSSLRSDHCRPDDPTFVELEFGVGADRYRLRRTPKFERLKRSGTGTTTAAPTALLEVADGDGWRGLAAKPVDVGHELASVLPLKQDQFLQVILLAQNRFQRFLLAKTEERRAVLRTLFSTARFEHFEQSLLARRRALDSSLEATLSAIDAHAERLAAQLGIEAPSRPAPAEWFQSAIEAVDAEVAEHDRLAVDADTRWVDAVSALRDATTVREKQDRRVSALAQRSRLDDASGAIDALRHAVSLATSAARVWPHVDAARAARGALETAVAALSRAETEWRANDPLVALGSVAGVCIGESERRGRELADPDTIDDAVIDSILESIGSARSGLADEAALVELDAGVSALDRAAVTAQKLLDDSIASRESLPREIAQLDERIVSLTAVAAREPDHREALDRMRAAIGAAHRAVDGETLLTAAREREVAASGRHRDAVTRFDDLLSARLSGQAIALAVTLEDGQKCPVCGSIEHPEPASSDAEPVSDDALDDARREVETRRGEFEAAATGAVDAARELDAAKAAAGGHTVDALETAISAARSALDESRAAAVSTTTTATERAAKTLELDDLSETIERRRAERDGAGAALSAQTARIADVTSRLTEHRAGFQTITERLAALDRVLSRARSVVTAREALELTTITADQTAQALDEHVSASDFDDVADLENARLTDSELTAAENTIRAHDDETVAVNSTLASGDLNGLPTDLVDLPVAQQNTAAAQTERDEEFSRRTAARERASSARGLVADVERERAASADLAAEHAVVRELAAVVHGEQPNTKRMRLETYVLAARLEEIIDAANDRLRTMTSSRYSLELDDNRQYRNTESGLGIAIRDEHTGRTRPTNSLSGGETFLASLALALGLAEVVTAGAGGVALDTLFVDEGFGSLDSETLEIAMSTLDGLRSGGRTIGLISHVDSMKEQIPAALKISVTAAGHSVVDQAP